MRTRAQRTHGGGVKDPIWLVNQLLQQGGDHKGIAQQPKQIAEEAEDIEALQTKQDRMKRLGDSRKHLERQL